MTITKADYLNVLNRETLLFSPPNLEELPSVSSVPSAVISRELRALAPMLRSKRKVDPEKMPKLRSHKPDGDVDQIFCYVAPRIKPKLGDNYTVFVFSCSLSSIAPPQPGSEQARPFDSGGLIDQLPTWNETDIRWQIEELTFSDDWRKPMAIYVGQLFGSLDDYRKATAPKNADPLNLPPTDIWNFTWELLVRDELPFAGRLIGVLDVHAQGCSSPLGIEATLSIQAKHDDSRLVFKRIDVDYENAEQSLLGLCNACIDMPGW